MSSLPCPASAYTQRAFTPNARCRAGVKSSVVEHEVVATQRWCLLLLKYSDIVALESLMQMFTLKNICLEKGVKFPHFPLHILSF